jgi:hypothetical protein
MMNNMNTTYVTAISHDSSGNVCSFTMQEYNHRTRKFSKVEVSMEFLLFYDSCKRAIQFQLPEGHEPIFIHSPHDKWQIWVKNNETYLISRCKDEVIPYYGYEVMAFESRLSGEAYAGQDSREVAVLRGDREWPCWKSVVDLI